MDNSLSPCVGRNGHRGGGGGQVFAVQMGDGDLAKRTALFKVDLKLWTAGSKLLASRGFSTFTFTSPEVKQGS